MIPKYLKIKGLYSYYTEQEIHFDVLTEASLFGIFGAVGSGKSSILEAITFALYGDTERLNKSGDDRTYNMMNLRSDDLLIDFECVAGKDGRHYRFTVRGRRNSKNFKDVKTFERRAYIQDENGWIPLTEQDTTESIIGLSYDNFRRTIIIPQGRFQEFIELKDAERTRMMKELFQLEKYDLSRNVGSLSKRNDMELSNLDGQLIGLGEINIELMHAEEIRRNEVRLEIKRSGDELLLVTEAEANLQKQKVAADKVQLLKIELADLQKREPAMRHQEEVLKTFETCSLHFRSIFDQKQNLHVSMAASQKTLDQNKIRVAELHELALKQKEVFQQLKPMYEKREELLNVSDELEKVIQIIDNQVHVEKKKGALLRGEEKLKEKESDIEGLKKQKVERETESESKKAALVDIQELGSVKSWFTMFDELDKGKKAIKAEADHLQTQIAAYRDTLSKKIIDARQHYSLEVEDNPSLDVFQKSIHTCLTNKEHKQKELNNQLIRLATRLALQQFAGNLENGAPCPLCGSEHHPSVLHADHSIPEEVKSIEKEIVILEEQEKALRGFLSVAEKVYIQIENHENQKAVIKQRWTESKERLEAHDREFVWNKFNKNDRSSFESHFIQVNKNLLAIKEGEAALKTLNSKIEIQLQEKTEQFEKPLQLLRNEILRLESTAATLTEQLRTVSLADFANEEKSSIRENITGLRKQYQDITKLFEQTDKELDVLETEKAVLAGSQDTLLKSLDSSQSELNNVQDLIDKQLVVYDFTSESQVAEILRSPISIDEDRKTIEQFKFALDTRSRDLQNLLKENADLFYDPAKHVAVIREKDTLTAQLNLKRKEEGGLDRLLKKMGEDLERKSLLLKEKGRLQLRKEHLDDLGRLFRSSGFVDYASSIYLQNLIQAANYRFHQMTHQQLHLELGDGNSFWVRDLLNGGHMRLLKTLSGGQKFQAALSLALALADHIHIRNESKHNFFFLDEGFGSLDKNALLTVFETLKSLRKENRIVGIISHVEDLQHEIQTYLKVTGSEEGSRIAASWLS